MKINYNNLLDEVAKDTGCTIKDVRSIITSFITTVKKHILNGDEVNILTFCKFKIGEASSRKAYSFKNKEVTTIPKRWLPKCDFVREFKQQFNKQA